MNEFGFFVLVLISGAYYTLIMWLTIGIKRLPKLKLRKETAQIRFSIIIAFRNEEKNLKRLLQSLNKIEYPKDLYEVLLVNDSSTDASEQLIESFIKELQQNNIRLIENIRKSQSPKKDAIHTAIQVSKFDWILTTDADCEVSEQWLASYNLFINIKKPVFIAGMVTYKNQKGFIHQFQQLDWLSLIGVTMGSFGWNKPLLCSGANLAYQKEAFYKVKGFKGNEHIASGDDVFLMQKMLDSFPDQVSYLSSLEALVQTQSVATWKELFQQRIRWAKKTSSMSNWFIKLVGISVFLVNLFLILLFLLFFFTNTIETLIVLALSVVFKIVFDSILLLLVSKNIHQKINLFNWLFSCLLYPFFSVSVVVFGLLSNYTWKGRAFGK